MGRFAAAGAGLSGVLLALLILFFGAAPANAHATLLATDPAQGARLNAAPTEVRLTFSEPVTVVPGSVRLLPGDRPAELLTVRTVDTVVVASLPELAHDARHTVSWRVVSADGHPISGLLSFSIGSPPIDGPAPPADEASPTTALGVAQAITTGVWYAGLLMVAGLLAFQVFCVRRVAGAVRPQTRGSAFSRLVVIGTAVAGLAAAALVPLRALALTDGFVPEPGNWPAVVGWQSPLAAVLTCAGMGATLLLLRQERMGAALVSAALALISPILTGHSAAVRPAWLMITGDAVHLVTTAVWAGGVLGLVLYLRGFRRYADTTPASGAVRGVAQVVGRFSGLAGSTLFTAGLVGVIMALLILPGRSALVDTTYGRLLLVKLTLVAMAGAIGGWNRFRLVPALERPDSAADPWRALIRILRIEVAVLAAVVLVTGFLVGQSPAGAGTGHSGQPGHRHAATATGPMPIRGTSDRLIITGTATPLGDGTTRLEFTVAEITGAMVHPVEPPTVTATLPDEDLGPTRYQSRNSPTGAHGTYLVEVETPVPGRWDILVGVRLSTFMQETVRVSVEVG